MYTLGERFFFFFFEEIFTQEPAAYIPGGEGIFFGFGFGSGFGFGPSCKNPCVYVCFVLRVRFVYFTCTTNITKNLQGAGGGGL